MSNKNSIILEVNGKSEEIDVSYQSLDDIYVNARDAAKLFLQYDKPDPDRLEPLSEQEVRDLSKTDGQIMSLKDAKAVCRTLEQGQYFFADKEERTEYIIQKTEENPSFKASNFTDLFQLRDNETELLSRIVAAEQNVKESGYTKESIAAYLDECAETVKQLPGNEAPKLSKKVPLSLETQVLRGAEDITSRISLFLSELPPDKDVVLSALEQIKTGGKAIQDAIYEKSIYGDEHSRFNGIKYNPVKTGLSEFMRKAPDSLAKEVFAEARKTPELGNALIEISMNANLPDNPTKAFINGEIELYDYGMFQLHGDYGEHNNLLVDSRGRSCWFKAEGSHLMEVGDYYEEYYPATLSNMKNLSALSPKDADVKNIEIILKYEELGIDRSAWERPEVIEYAFSKMLNEPLETLQKAEHDLAGMFKSIPSDTREAIAESLKETARNKTEPLLSDFSYYADNVSQFSDSPAGERMKTSAERMTGIVHTQIDETYSVPFENRQEKPSLIDKPKEQNADHTR